MVKLSLFPLQDRCSHFRAPGKLTDTQLEQGCTFWKEQLTVLNVRRTDARYVYRYVNATDNFSHKVNGKTYNIIQKFDCSAKCLTYLLTCQKCHKQIFWQNDRLVSTKMNQLQKQFPQLR